MNNLWGDSPAKEPTGTGEIGNSSDVWPSKANPGTSGGAPAGSASKPAQAAVHQKAGGTDRDAYWANKEARDLEKERVYREEDIPAIRRSTAYNVAGGLCAAALENGILSFGNTAKGKQLGMYLGFLDQIAEHVYAKLNGVELEVDAEDASEEQVEQKEAELG